MALYKTVDADKIHKFPVFLLWFRRYTPFDEFGGGESISFEGDHRVGPSTSPNDTSRTYACLFFNREEVLYGFSGSSGTLSLGPLSVGLRAWLGYPTRDFAEVSLKILEYNYPNVVAFTAHTAGANPLVPGSPDIDTIIKAQFDFSNPKLMKVSCQAFGDNFPNLEVFLATGSGRPALLIDGRTTGGKDTGPMTRLPGSHSSHLLGQCSTALSLDRGELESYFKAKPVSLPDYTFSTNFETCVVGSMAFEMDPKSGTISLGDD
jgi:hypothetical protein